MSCATTLGAQRVHDPERVAVIIDHVAPAASVATANAQVRVRRWVRRGGHRALSTTWARASATR